MLRLFAIAEKRPHPTGFEQLALRILREVDHSGQEEQAATGIYSHAAKKRARNAQENADA
jgi:hypothetical protein